MFILIKKIFCIGSLFLSSLVSTTPLSCISLKNQQCKVRPKIADINSNNPIFYPFSPFCIPDTVKDLNVREFNLMSRTNETRHIKWHETCKCICRLDKIICNSKQRWNEDKYRCECKELIDKGVCDKVYVWNPSNCECECDKSCNIGEYLDYSSCECRKKLIDPLVEECADNIDETKLVKITVINENKGRCTSYLVYKVLFFIFFIISCGTIIYIVYHGYVNQIKYDLPY